jgi:hypothetical protein
MAEKELKAQGTVDPSKKPNWLQEVKLDAARNTVEHLRRQKERQEFEEAKARGITVEEIIGKGRTDLDLPEPENVGGENPAPLESEKDTNDSEVEDLKRQLKAERMARTKAENKLKTQTDEPQVDGEPEDSDEAGKDNK